MKALIIIASTLIILSSTVFANWFDELNQSKTNSKSYITSDTASNEASSSQVTQNNVTSTKGNMGFGMSFGSNGMTRAHTATSPNTSANMNYSNTTDNNATSNSFVPIGFNPLYSPTPEIKAQVQKKPPAKDTDTRQNYKELRTMWEAQRKQAEEMLKRIDEAEKADNVTASK